VINSETNIPVSIDPALLSFTSGNTPLLFQPEKSGNNPGVFELSPDTIPAGQYSVTATVTSPQGTKTTNAVPILVSEPFIVAWTFDWEGWDVNKETPDLISAFATEYGNIPFTHFINPRTFLPDVLTPARQTELRDFFLKRSQAGDEIALHIHMQYDLVTAAGVTPVTTNHWGMRPEDGYDVPATVYSTDEFRTLISFGQSILRDIGLPQGTGYRSGGWSITGTQLAVLSELGFSYDSSGRDKPRTGSFSSIPWQLPPGAQPYYPDYTDQNKKAADRTGILEIPNNAVTTYESSANELLKRANTVYPGGILTIPKTFVVVSHPQFSDREFTRIPAVLSALKNTSFSEDRGPVVYGTTGDIYTLWKSLPY
jgi:hypothetical protein